MREPVLGWRQKVHKPGGLGSGTPQKLQVQVLELDEKTRHTLVRTRHGDDQERRLIYWNQIWALTQKIHRRPQVRREEGSTAVSKEPAKPASRAPGGERNSGRLSFASSINFLCAFGLSRSQSANARG